MTAPGFTTTSGVALAPAPPEPGPDGTTMTRIGLWAADTGRGPVVLTADEIALALAHGGETVPSRYRILVDEAARQTLAGVEKLGRAQLRTLATQWRCGDDDVWPGRTQWAAERLAERLCHVAHRDR
ncbi:MAG TPA: hypothetical protein VG674_09910 [Amycolatopsis sp.]|nr:hypothetical protein [Amycolatopsis sp.]